MCVRKWAWLWGGHVFFLRRSPVACPVRSDVTCADLSPCRWLDADWREGSARWGGLWLEQTGTAGCDVLSTVVRNIKQSGIPTRYKRAAWSRGLWVEGDSKLSPEAPLCELCWHTNYPKILMDWLTWTCYIKCFIAETWSVWGKVVRWLLNMQMRLVGDSLQRANSISTFRRHQWLSATLIRTKLVVFALFEHTVFWLWMLIKLSWGGGNHLNTGSMKTERSQTDENKKFEKYTQTCERLIPPRLLRLRLSVIFEYSGGVHAWVCPWSCPCIFWPAERATPELICYTSDVEHTPEHLVTAFAASLLATAQRGHIRLNQLK